MLALIRWDCVHNFTERHYRSTFQQRCRLRGVVNCVNSCSSSECSHFQTRKSPQVQNAQGQQWFNVNVGRYTCFKSVGHTDCMKVQHRHHKKTILWMSIYSLCRFISYSNISLYGYIEWFYFNGFKLKSSPCPVLAHI